MTSEILLVSAAAIVLVFYVGLLTLVLLPYRLLSKALIEQTTMLPKLLSQAGAIQKATSSDEAVRASVGAVEAHDHLSLMRELHTQALLNERKAKEDAQALEEARVPDELRLPDGVVVDLLSKS